jgi:site-specific DNA recombinase
MRVAVYARKSTAQHVAAAEKSTTLQIEQARRFVRQHGLGTIDERFVVIDDNISGANFSTRQLLPLVHAAKQTPRPFDALVALAVDRVGREQIRTSAAFLDLVEAGVRVYLHEDGGQELKLDTPLSKVMLGLRGYAAEEYRHQIQLKTKLTMHDKASRGHLCGGRTYGYSNEIILDAQGRRSHVERRIRDDQAVHVRRIFQMAADGWGVDRIAKTLTAERVPPPRATGRGWAPSAVRAILRNEVYRGVIVYGRSERVYRSGRRGQERRDPSQWLRREVPELAIVPSELWTRVQAIFARKVAAFTRAPNGTLIGRPVGTRHSRYLLSGISQCGVCEGTIFAYSQRHRQGMRASWYRCYLAATRGPAICTNGLWVPMAPVDRLVLDAVGQQVLDPTALDGYLDAMVHLWKAKDALIAAQQAALKTELRQVEVEIAALEQQLVRGAPWALIAEPMTARRERRDTLQAALAQADARDDTAAQLGDASLRSTLAKKLADWRGLTAQQPEQARLILTRLLDGRRIVFRPLGRGKTCEITGAASYTALLDPGRIRLNPKGD